MREATDEDTVWFGLNPNETLIAATPKTPRGYFIVLADAAFDTGRRIRLYLLQEEDSQTFFVRHLDMTTLLANHLWPLLRQAAGLGGSVAELPSANAGELDRASVYTPELLAAKSRAELSELLLQTNQAVGVIKKRLAEHYAKGGERTEWVDRAVRATKAYGRLTQMLQFALSALKKKEKEANIERSAAGKGPFLIALREELVMRFGEESTVDIMRAAGERAVAQEGK